MFGDKSLTRNDLLAQRGPGLWHRASLTTKNRTRSSESTHETSRDDAITSLLAFMPLGFAEEAATIVQAMRQVVQKSVVRVVVYKPVCDSAAMRQVVQERGASECVQAVVR